jgi:hypothetical protein
VGLIEGSRFFRRNGYIGQINVFVGKGSREDLEKRR